LLRRSIVLLEPYTQAGGLSVLTGYRRDLQAARARIELLLDRAIAATASFDVWLVAPVSRAMEAPAGTLTWAEKQRAARMLLAGRIAALVRVVMSEIRERTERGLQRVDSSLRIVRAFGRSPIVTGLEFSRARVGYFFSDRGPVQMTPATALVFASGDH